MMWRVRAKLCKGWLDFTTHGTGKYSKPSSLQLPHASPLLSRGVGMELRKLSHLAINKRIRLILRVEPFVKSIPSRKWVMHVCHAVYKILLTVYVCVCINVTLTADAVQGFGCWLSDLIDQLLACLLCPEGLTIDRKKISSLTKIYVPALSLTSPPPPQPEAHTRSTIQARLLH